MQKGWALHHKIILHKRDFIRTLATRSVVLERAALPIHLFQHAYTENNKRFISSSRQSLQSHQQDGLTDFFPSQDDTNNFTPPVKKIPNQSFRDPRVKQKIFRPLLNPINDDSHNQTTDENKQDLKQQHNLSIPLLYEQLDKAARQGNLKKVYGLINELICEKKENISARIYSALILVNTSPDHGSVSRVKRLLVEMERDGISLDGGICKRIIKVLSVHPDHLLRADIINYMEKRWFHFDDEVRLDMIVGQLREGSIEMGLESITELINNGGNTSEWIYDMIVYMLLEVDQVGRALEIMMKRHGKADITTWYALLEHAASSRHYATALYIWNGQIMTDSIKPSTGTCIEILSTAAYHGDGVMADQVLKYMLRREMSVTSSEYELCCHAYLFGPTSDLKAAIQCLLAMSSKDLYVSRISTRPLFEFFKNNKGSQTKAFYILQSLRQTGKYIPVPLLNCIIEAFEVQDDLQGAIMIYKSLHLFEKFQAVGQPRIPFADTNTFEILYKLARQAQNKAYDVANFFHTEQIALKVPYTSLSLDRLISCCLDSIRLDPAWDFVIEMQSRGWWLRMGTLKSSFITFATNNDERCWKLLERSEQIGIDTTGWREEIKDLKK